MGLRRVIEPSRRRRRMPDFSYVARNLQGEKVSGSISAASEKEVVSMLSAQALFPVTVASTEKRQSGFSFGGRVNGQLMANFYFQLSSLLKSGVPLLKSITILR